MPFHHNIKMRMFIRCARLCCLCCKQCGTNIEAAHIIAEADGGPNDEENGIPLCYDCHTEVGHYNDHHPKGNKFRPTELKERRNHIYRLVDAGVIHAQVVANQVRSRANGEPLSLPAELKRPEPSGEAKKLLKIMLSTTSTTLAPGGKLQLLTAEDRAYVLDQAIEEAPTLPAAVDVLMRIASSKLVTEAEAKVIIEKTIRHVTLCGTAPSKAALLNGISPEALAESSDEIRRALFEEVIEIIRNDQYVDVNEVVPALAGHCDAVPPELYSDFALALLTHSQSGARKGAPAAVRMLANLPIPLAQAGVNALDVDYFARNNLNETLKKFVTRYQHLAAPEHQALLKDFVTLSRRQFAEKHLPEDD